MVQMPERGNQSNVEPTVIVIFGASGDLTQRKLVPALHSLGCVGLLPPNTQVLGVARSDLTNETYRGQLYAGVTSHARLSSIPASIAPTKNRLVNMPVGVKE